MSENNIYKDIQTAIIKKFGCNCSAKIEFNIHPIDHEFTPSVIIKLYEIQPDGVSKVADEIHISSFGGIEQLPMSIEALDYDLVRATNA